MERVINVTANKNAVSQETKRILKGKLREAGFIVSDSFNPNAELIVCGRRRSFAQNAKKF